MRDLKEFAERLVKLATLEVEELAQILKEEYGIVACAAGVGATDKPKKRRVANDDYLREQEIFRRNQMAQKQGTTHLKKGKNPNFRRR